VSLVDVLAALWEIIKFGSQLFAASKEVAVHLRRALNNSRHIQRQLGAEPELKGES
jgi:hypothetical protein